MKSTPPFETVPDSLRNAAGFTLLELMIVVIVISIITALAYPSLENTMAERRLHQASRDVVNLLQFARMQAILKGRAYRVDVALAGTSLLGGSLQVFIENGNTCANSAVQVRSLDLSDFYPDVGLLSVKPDSVLTNSLCFKPDGRVYMANTGLAPVMQDTTASTFHTRPSTVAFVLRRIASYSGGNEAVGVRREVILPHLGVARLNELH